MKFSNRIFHDRIDGTDKLSPAEREQVEHDPRLQSAIAENRALRTLHEEPGPPPDRGRMLNRVYHEAELLEEPRMSLLKRLFEGKRWYAQTGLALGLTLVVCALAVFLPTDSTMKPPPAWGQTNGYKLDYNLGRVSPQMINAVLDVSGGLSRPTSEQACVASSTKVNVISTKDLTAVQLAELKESLALIVDGEIEVISIGNLDVNSTDFAGAITIIISDPDKAEIERIIAGTDGTGEVIELEGINIYTTEGALGSEIELLISRPDSGYVVFGDSIDPTELEITLESLNIGYELAESLAAAEAGLRLIQLDDIYLSGAEFNEELIVGLRAAQDGLAAVDLEQLQLTLGGEEHADVLLALAEARSELDSVELGSYCINLNEMDSAELEASLAAMAEQYEVFRADLAEVDLEYLQLELAEIQNSVATEELKRALIVFGETDLENIDLRVGEVNTIDLSKFDSAIEKFNYYQVGEAGAPVNVVTKVVDGELIATIAYGADDAQALDELQISLAEVVEGLPDPEVTTSTWFYDSGTNETIGWNGMVINLNGHSFQFPTGADPEEIQEKIDVWFRESMPYGAVSPTVRVISGLEGKAATYVVVTDGTEASAAGCFEVSEGTIELSTYGELCSAVTVVIKKDEETGEQVIYIDGDQVDPDVEEDGTDKKTK